jgi:hypothetical protein
MMHTDCYQRCASKGEGGGRGSGLGTMDIVSKRTDAHNCEAKFSAKFAAEPGIDSGP